MPTSNSDKWRTRIENELRLNSSGQSREMPPYIRRTKDNRLLVTVAEPVEHDRQKLRALTDPHIWFAYWIGVLLTLGKNNVASAEIYASGKHDPEMSGVLAGLLKEAGIGVA